MEDGISQYLPLIDKGKYQKNIPYSHGLSLKDRSNNEVIVKYSNWLCTGHNLLPHNSYKLGFNNSTVPFLTGNSACDFHNLFLSLTP